VSPPQKLNFQLAEISWHSAPWCHMRSDGIRVSGSGLQVSKETSSTFKRSNLDVNVFKIVDNTVLFPPLESKAPNRRCSHSPGSHLRRPGRGRGDSHREVALHEIAAARGLPLFICNEALMGTDLQQDYAMARHGRGEPVPLHRYGFMLPEVPHLGFFASQVGRQVAPCKSRLSGSIAPVE